LQSQLYKIRSKNTHVFTHYSTIPIDERYIGPAVWSLRVYRNC